MKITFACRDLDKTRGHYDLVSRIIYTIADNWHEWHSPNPVDDRFADYFRQHPQHQELAQKSFARSLAYGGSALREVSVTDLGSEALPSIDSYPLDLALDFLGQPLKVLVENEISDGHFYGNFLGVVDPDLATLFRSSPRPPIAFENGGGNMEMVKIVEHRVVSAQAHSLRTRLVVLADSDARYPGHSPTETNKLLDLCRELGVPAHVTAKRSQESYLPDAVLAEAAGIFGDLQPSVAFITSLSSVQRDHYPIKHGLAVSLSDGENRLYSNVLPGQVGAPRLKIPRIADFFRLSYSGDINTDHLAERKCSAEIGAIADLLRREL